MCHTENIPSSQLCHACGFNLDTQYVSPNAAPDTNLETIKKCPMCTTNNMMFNEKCSICDYNFVNPECENCNHINTMKDAASCENCKKPLVEHISQEAEPVQLSQQPPVFGSAFSAAFGQTQNTQQSTAFSRSQNPDSVSSSNRTYNRLDDREKYLKYKLKYLILKNKSKYE
jgi:hypothetical protein